MTILLSDRDVNEIFSTDIANKVMSECFSSLGGKDSALSTNVPRLQISTEPGWFRIQFGSIPSKDFMGFKAYLLTKGYGPRYTVFLYKISTGELAAIIDADTLTVRRTGAVSAVATQYLSKKDARTLGIFGSSRQARSMLESISLVRKLDEVRVYSPNKAHRESFLKEMSATVSIPISAVENPKAAAMEMAIVGTATGNKTMSPILYGEWLEKGAHVNAIGAVGRGRVELDTNCFRRASLIAVDSLEECAQSSEELIDALESGAVKKDDLLELSGIVNGSVRNRSSEEEISIFKSQGAGVQDIFSASAIYEAALRNGFGKDIGEVGRAQRAFAGQK